MPLTKAAFDGLRSALGQPRQPDQALIANQDQLKQMGLADGLQHWKDGPGSVSPAAQPPLLTTSQTQTAHLWVVRQDDVVHAEEHCAFGTSLESGIIKHTNLTGGRPAYSGGELIFLDKKTIVINGCSGRYGPRDKYQLDQVVKAFSNSGYGVWSMGFDEETNRPARFLGTFPEWVTA